MERLLYSKTEGMLILYIVHKHPLNTGKTEKKIAAKVQIIMTSTQNSTTNSLFCLYDIGGSYLHVEMVKLKHK